MWLQVTRFRYLNVRVPGKDFVGDLWALAREEQGLTLRWNVDCEAPDMVGFDGVLPVRPGLRIRHGRHDCGGSGWGLSTLPAPVARTASHFNDEAQVSPQNICESSNIVN